MRNFIQIVEAAGSLTGKAYHGTAYIFDRFEHEYLGSVTDSSDARVGVWLTDDYERARDAAIEAKNVSEDDLASVHIRQVSYNLRNPLYVDDIRDYDPEDVAEMAEEAKAQGHDGIVFEQGEGTERDILILDIAHLRFADKPVWKGWTTEFEPITESELSPSFWNWFGNSAVVDDAGDPMVVYHGGKSWRVAPGTTWFTDDPHVADGYADQGFDDPEIKPCYLRIIRPLDLRDESVVHDLFPDNDWIAHHGVGVALKYSRDLIRLAIDHAESYGYDGVIHPDSDVTNKGSHTSYVIFSPNQVKAAKFQGWEKEVIYGDHNQFDDGNKGTYSDSQDITESAPRTLYHGTLKEYLPSIMKNWLVPEVGDFVSDFYDPSGDEGYDPEVDSLEPLVFGAAKADLKRCHSAISWRLRGKNISPTPENIIRYGAIVVMKDHEEKFIHAAQNGVYNGEHPRQVEPGDFYSHEEVEPSHVLVNGKLRDLFRRAKIDGFVSMIPPIR